MNDFSLLKKENIIKTGLSPLEFEALSLGTFQFQYQNNTVYRDWVKQLHIRPENVSQITEIPFLPIEFFKSQKVLSSAAQTQTIQFTSSSTSSQQPASHFVNDPSLYELSFKKGFQHFYGEVSDYVLLALLPNYLQRSGSSLVYMCDQLIRNSGSEQSGFYLNDYERLLQTIAELKKNSRKKILLIGVSYALLDLCELKPGFGDGVTVMETGGMKGRRSEMLKPELHAFLKSGLGVPEIHSEYGMTELLSQAYSQGDGLFRSPSWMKFFIRETDDPLSLKTDGRTGGINVIDLANLHSCSFIATKDLGRLHPDGALELMGRFTDSDVRGCNLMVETQ